MFEWCVVRFGSKNGTKKTCVQERLDYLILRSVVMAGISDDWKRKRICTLTMNKILMRASNVYAYGHDLDSLIMRPTLL